MGSMISEWWQHVVVGVVVAAAGAYVLRLAWKAASRSPGAGCGRCGSCGGASDAQPTGGFVSLDRVQPTPAAPKVRQP